MKLNLNDAHLYGIIDLGYVEESNAVRVAEAMIKGGVDLIGLMKQAKQAGMKYYFIEQEEYAVTAFDSLDYDYNWLAERWKA